MAADSGPSSDRTPSRLGRPTYSPSSHDDQRRKVRFALLISRFVIEAEKVRSEESTGAPRCQADYSCMAGFAAKTSLKLERY
jgi:hypothetical protein